ncbi:sugar transferase [Paraclostridium sordellii]|uniref:sugar transferase n=1 Tax=Paraclostridium sordellii TaxID=1505 RepID=UPI0005425B7C|nr:sugar transferase [Paeniclostridium sordellii]CEK35532.1 capsular polysaccharide biosynthsis protein,Putative colanic biosynthesis UDP-glucose lipid carrier transferase,undecaprenyl-phosphate galactose phosphotransferase,exopolysaccharide biosynthesis polyprenyl glycosylphosphotransferase,Bacterial sugar transferase [[Clostridium] sordellii] [Paeniclostridium sordellii]
MQNKCIDNKNVNKHESGYIYDADIYVSKIYIFLKRVIDILGSLIGLILLSPIFLIVAIAIKIEDPKGSIFFGQKRNGKYPKTFKMYKFRSMVYNAEELLEKLKEQNEMTGPAFKMKNDPRITKIGKFIRKTSIDELPQLFNILKGDMSFVGPRPPIPREVEEYDEYQLQRLSVKPGLTCYWQVSGRNNIDFDEWIELDLKYIKERNIFIDIKLILLTIPALLGDKNAS